MINGIYATQHSRVWNSLAGPVFDVLNNEGAEALKLVGSGCIDAPDQIPAGSVKRYGPAVLQSISSRPEPDDGQNEAQEVEIERLINEILENARSTP